MVLLDSIVELIRDEIGGGADFGDDNPVVSPQLDTLENIYNNVNRGNSNVLRTALICWRRRREAYQARGFDATAGGSLFARRQRMKYLDKKVKEYELLVDTTFRHRQSRALGKFEVDDADGGTEF